MPDKGVDADKRATLKRFAALGAVSPLAGLIESSSPQSDTREAIAGYVTATPGAHFSKIRDDLQLGTGETQHHLRRLLDIGAIESHRDGDYRRFFTASLFTAFEKTVLGYLRRPTTRGMLLQLLRDPTVSGGALANSVGVSRSTISKYAAELTEAGILGREEGYVLAQPETVLVLLVRFADSFDAETRHFAAEAADLIHVDR